MSSGLFPRIGEHDIYSFPEPDLHLTLIPRPYDFPFFNIAFNWAKIFLTVISYLKNLPYNN